MTGNIYLASDKAILGNGGPYFAMDFYLGRIGIGATVNPQSYNSVSFQYKSAELYDCALYDDANRPYGKQWIIYDSPLKNTGYSLFDAASKSFSAVQPATLAAAALAASNYTDAAISPTSPAFSNAVLSVGLGIDTNTVAVINELVDSAHDLPVSGATSVGALLLALAAAVAALKKNLRYSYNTTTVSSGTTPTVTDVADRAINTATLGSSVTAATVTLPAATANRARDFFIDLTIEATTAPTLTFIDPATGTTINVAFGSDSLADIDTGKNAVLFTEFPNYTWLVSVKHEEVSA